MAKHVPQKTEGRIDRRVKILGFLGFTAIGCLLFCVGLFVIGPAIRTHFTPPTQPVKSKPVYTPPTADQEDTSLSPSQPSEEENIDVEITERSSSTPLQNHEEIPVARESDIRQDSDSISVRLEPTEKYNRSSTRETTSTSPKSPSAPRRTHEPDEEPSTERPRVATHTTGKVTAESAEAGSRLYKVQAGTFANRANAEALAEDLRSKGYKVEIRTVQVEDRTLHRVQLGAYKSREDAQELANDLSEQGYSPTVVEDKR
jgi:cell division protein FtsN